DEQQHVRCRDHRRRSGWQHCGGIARARWAPRDCVRTRKVSDVSHWRIVAAVQHEGVYSPGAARKILARRVHEEIRRRNLSRDCLFLRNKLYNYFISRIFQTNIRLADQNWPVDVPNAENHADW